MRRLQGPVPGGQPLEPGPVQGRVRGQVRRLLRRRRQASVSYLGQSRGWLTSLRVRAGHHVCGRTHSVGRAQPERRARRAACLRAPAAHQGSVSLVYSLCVLVGLDVPPSSMCVACNAQSELPLVHHMQGGFICALSSEISPSALGRGGSRSHLPAPATQSACPLGVWYFGLVWRLGRQRLTPPTPGRRVAPRRGRRRRVGAGLLYVCS